MKIRYDKLVRDNIIDIIESDGKQSTYELVSDDVKLDYLHRKLYEELDEYIDSEDVEELADVIEVVYAILKTKGYTNTYLELLRLDKVARNGSFDKGIVLKEVKD